MSKNVMDGLGEFIKQVTGPIDRCSEVSEEAIWSTHGTSIWQAERFVGTSHFHPIYRYKDLYSYSPLSLILVKGTLRINPRVTRSIGRRDFAYYSGKDTIDLEIVRLGGPQRPRFLIRDPDEYARRMADALREDAHAVEKRHPNYTNVILCGGKDSLNLLLLPWRNRVVVASAGPNFDLVRRFITENGLKYDVVQLYDDDNSLMKHEILANSCRNNLEHCRWGPHLRRLSSTFGGKVIFWKGLWGDAIMTPKWKTLTLAPNAESGYVRQLFKAFRGKGEYRFNRLLERSTLTQRYFFQLLWNRGAMWQGSHISMLRQLTNSLVLSAYHGPKVREIVSQVDLHKAVQHDVRPMIGEYLHGCPVIYPKTNPCPPLSDVRKGISHLEPFVNELSSIGVIIRNG